MKDILPSASISNSSASTPLREKTKLSPSGSVAPATKIPSPAIIFSLTCTSASKDKYGATFISKLIATCFAAVRIESNERTDREVRPCVRASTKDVRKLPSSSRATF